MKPENCKIGMKIERFWDSHNNVKKGSVYTVAGVNVEGESVKLEETNDNYWYDLSLFRPVEPTNKFEVGDEVLYKAENGINYECTIFGIAKQKDKFDGKYAISFVKGSGKVVNKIVKECKLSQLKKKDELQVGDKFKVKTAEGASKRINEILGIFKDKYYNQTKYAAKRLNGNYEGFVDVYNSEMIAEIVYE